DIIDTLDPVPLQHALEPLPSSLVLNEINYPDLERLTIEKREVEATISTSLISESDNPTALKQLPPSTSNIYTVVSHSSSLSSLSSSTSSSSSSVNQSIYVDTQRIRLLENRVHQIELELMRRQLTEKLFFITFGGYFLIKFLRVLFC
ncbi:unnamed protein product, partial [Schistosoma turkestanicum]